MHGLKRIYGCLLRMSWLWCW